MPERPDIYVDGLERPLETGDFVIERENGRVDWTCLTRIYHVQLYSAGGGILRGFNSEFKEINKAIPSLDHPTIPSARALPGFPNPNRSPERYDGYKYISPEQLRKQIKIVQKQALWYEKALKR
jgi:hypothetical protein